MINLKIWVRVVAFLTSYTPLWIILLFNSIFQEDRDGNFILVDVIDYVIWQEKKMSFSYPRIEFNFMVFLMLFLIVFSIMILSFFLRYKKKEKINKEHLKIVSVESQDGNLLSYIFTYVIPFIGASGDKEFLTRGLLMFFIASFYMTSELLIFNPLLRWRGYYIYKIIILNENGKDTIEKNIYVLSDKKVHEIKVGKIYNMNCITENLYFLFA